MNSPLIKKKIPLFLLAAVLVFTGGLALTSADTSGTSAESDIPGQSELSLTRPAALAVTINQDNSVFLLAAEASEQNPAGLTDQQLAEWQENEQEGPPPWAAVRKKAGADAWFDGDREEPPPWAGGPSDLEKAEWEDSEQEGPPPWAAARKKAGADTWFDGDREGPPPWAGGPSDLEKAGWQANEQEGPPPWAGPKKDKSS